MSKSELNVTNVSTAPKALPIGSSKERRDRALNLLSIMYDVLGNPPSSDALAVMALKLTTKLSDAQINRAVNDCMEDGRFVRLPEIFRAAGMGKDGERVEALRAWDEVMVFVEKYVSNDVHGNYGPEHGWKHRTPPEMSSRIIDTVRATGGWRSYKLLDDAGHPHQQKRFVDAYVAWKESTSLPASRFLAPTAAIPMLPIVKRMDPPQLPAPCRTPESGPRVTPKPVSQEHNEAWYAERRRQSKVALEQWQQKRQSPQEQKGQ